MTASPAFRARGTVASGTGTSAAPGAPAGFASGDGALLVLYAEGTENPWAGLSVPAGWTLVQAIFNSSSGLEHHFRVYKARYRDISGTPGTITWTTSRYYEAAVLAWSGVDDLDVVDASNTPTVSGSSSISCGSLTTIKANTTVVAVYACINGWSSTVAAPSGFTVRDGHAGTFNGSFAVADKAQSTAGSTGSVTASGNAGNGTTGLLISLSPAIQVTASADDADQFLDGTDFSRTRAQLQFGSSGYWSGMVFRGTGIPAGATITAAKLQLQFNTLDDPRGLLYGELATTVDDYVTTASVIGRSRTVASAVVWSANNVGTSAYVDSPDFKDAIQEIVNQVGYSGDIGVIVGGYMDGSGNNAWGRSYDDDPLKAPRLVVTYTAPSVTRDVTTAAAISATVKRDVTSAAAIQIPGAGGFSKGFSSGFDGGFDAAAVTRDVTSAAAISTTATRDVTTAAAISTTVTRDVTTAAAIATTATRDVTSAAAISTTAVRNVASAAAISAVVSRDVTSAAAISATVTRDVTSAAAVSATVTRDVTSAAAISVAGGVSRDVTTSAAISATVTRDVTTAAAVSTTLTRDVTTTAAVSQTAIRNVTTTAAIATTALANVTTAAAISTTSTRNVTTSAAISTTATRDVTSAAAISATVSTSVTTSAAISTAAQKNVTSAASISQAARIDITTGAAISARAFLDITTSAAISAGAVVTSTATRAVSLSTSTARVVSYAPSAAAPAVQRLDAEAIREIQL